MKLKIFIICFLCFAAAAGLMYFGSTRLDVINAERSEMKLVVDAPLENAPPSLAFATVALGAFRGLVVDVLWIRADQLKEDGKFFDAKQLAEWITILQPRFAAVWDFHAWNMAYNISVAIPSSRPQERWQWVKNGYELLRDKGIPKNPHSIDLYRSLGWIFQHKIAGITDDCHKYYKLQLYNAMNPLVGPQTQEYYKSLAATSKTLDEIEQDADIVKFLNELAAADAAFAKPEEVVDNYLALRQQPLKFSQKAFEVIDRYRQTKTLEKFDIFAKAYYLRHTWKLEPEMMVQLNEKYGPVDFNDPNKVLPLDWRLPDTHAIYWGALGLKNASQEKYSIDELNTDRIVFHSIQNLYRMGKFVVYTSRVPDKDDPCSIVERQSIFTFPDLRMFDRYDQALIAVKAKYKVKDESNMETLENAHRNTLKRGVLLFYQAGHMKKATEIYNTLRKEYPNDKDVNMPLADYTRARLIEELKDIGLNDATEIISLMLREGFYRYAVGDDDEAFGREKMAKEVYDHYQGRYADEGVDRVVLPDFNVMKYIGISGFLNDQQYPDYVRQNLLQRIQVERPELYEQLNEQHDIFMQEMQKQENESRQQ
jgi:hypothetical protein